MSEKSSLVSVFAALIVYGLCFLSCGRGEQKQRGISDAEVSKGSTHQVEEVRRVVEIVRPAVKGGRPVTVARYETRYKYPVLEEIKRRDEEFQRRQEELTAEIKKRQKEEKKKQRDEQKVLRSSLPPGEIPHSLDLFNRVWHFPPVPQFYTGTCWSFSTTSFLESEVKRITGKEVKLSEMATVYFEYMEKARRFVRERGDSLFAEGSEANAVTRIWKKYGAFPFSVYRGVMGEDKRYDHIRMYREMRELLEAIKDKSMWDDNTAISMLRVILDREMGRPPEKFTYDGVEFSPGSFIHGYLKINPDDYVSFISTLEIPFYTQGEFKVPDNWWHDKSYYNLPLEEFYSACKNAIEKGYSAVIAIDVSEPGKDPDNDVMFIPDYDLPPDRIDQLAREYRFSHKVTTDDHGVHLVGYANYKGYGWFLVKDSGRSSRRGRFKGYYFIREDYLRLKMLSFMVHRDAVREVLAKFK